MEEPSLDEALMLALRRSPGSRRDELAVAVGLPRTNFGRQLKNAVGPPLQRLLAAGLIERSRGRYKLTEEGRRRLSERISALP